jgi:hypothetical protein
MRMACFCLLLSAPAARCQYGGVTAQAGFLSNGGVTVDSFDSSTNTHSIWLTNSTYRWNYFQPGTHYGIWSNSLSYVSNSFPSRTANAAIFTESNVVQLVGPLYLAGYIETGPNGAAFIGSQSSVGDLAWCFGPTGTGPGTGQTGIEPGHLIPAANMNFSSYPLPAFHNSWQASWLPVPTPGAGSIIKIGGVWWYTNGVWTNLGGTYYTNAGSGFAIRGITYSQVITNRLENTNFVYYSMGQLTSSLFVDAQYVVLYLTNGLSYPGGLSVFMLNTNADIAVYSTGNVLARGNGVIDNLGNYTHAFSLYDVAGYPISVELGGNAMATGNYYLPSSTFKFDGGGGNGDFVGSIVCYSCNDNGHVNIHFDGTQGGLPLPPSITQPPTNQFVQAGSDVTFSVDAIGSGLNYQWYFFAITNTADWPITNSLYDVTNEIPGATNSSLDLTDVQFTNAGYYGVVVSNMAAFVQSREVNLTVYTNVLTPQIVQAGSDATFSVNASDSAANYQWYFLATTDTGYWPYTNLVYSATNEIPGATNSSLDITDVQSTNEGYYGVIISNFAGFARSWPASLTVYTNATPFLSGALNPTNGQFQLSISGVTGLNYSVQASTNLVDWVPLWTNASPFGFAETNMPAYPQRFYRSVFIP